MILPELTGYFRRLLVLGNRKTELVLSISELEAKLVVGTMLHEHLLEMHWGPGHNPVYHLEQKNKKLEEELSPLRTEYATVCAQIDQIYQEARSKVYDFTA